MTDEHYHKSHDAGHHHEGHHHHSHDNQYHRGRPDLNYLLRQLVWATRDGQTNSRDIKNARIDTILDLEHFVRSVRSKDKKRRVPVSNRRFSVKHFRSYLAGVEWCEKLAEAGKMTFERVDIAAKSMLYSKGDPNPGAARALASNLSPYFVRQGLIFCAGSKYNLPVFAKEYGGSAFQGDSFGTGGDSFASAGEAFGGGSVDTVPFSKTDNDQAVGELLGNWVTGELLEALGMPEEVGDLASIVRSVDVQTIPEAIRGPVASAQAFLLDPTSLLRQ